MDKFNEYIQQSLEDDNLKGLTRHLNVFSGRQGPQQILNGKEIIMLSSNNYLGLADNDFIQSRAISAVKEYGLGSCASRTISGTLAIHQECERAISGFKGAESALLFSCGYMANVAVLTSLASKGDLILSDELNHASIIDGCRLSKAETIVYKHKDITDLSQKLQNRNKYRNVFLVTDGVFSMDGDIAPLNRYVPLSKEFDFSIIVDDAHGVGVLGKNGKGTPYHFGVEKEIDVIVGTLGKAIGCYGAYVTCSKNIRQFLINRARPFIFTTSLPPFTIASVIAAFDFLRENGEVLVADLWEKTKFYRSEIDKIGIYTFDSETNIVPLFTGSNTRTMSISNCLRDNGVFAHGIRPPAVPENQGRLRTTVIRSHTYKQLEFAIDNIKKIW